MDFDVRHKMIRIFIAHLFFATAWILPTCGVIAKHPFTWLVVIGSIVLCDCVRISGGLDGWLFKRIEHGDSENKKVNILRSAAMFILVISASSVSTDLHQAALAYFSLPLTMYGMIIFQLSLIRCDYSNYNSVKQKLAEQDAAGNPLLAE